MDLIKYVGKSVRIDLTNGFYYKGIVLSCDNNSIELRDMKGNRVSLKEEAILYIREES